MLAQLIALAHNDDFLLKVYTVTNVCELAITVGLFYLTHRMTLLDNAENEKAFHLNNFLLSHRIIEQMHAAGIVITAAFLEPTYQSISYLFAKAPHHADYASYSAFIRANFGTTLNEAQLEAMLTDRDAERLRLQYIELFLFIVLIIFQIFSIWYVLQP